MKIYEINTTQFIAKPLEMVFDFFSKPENLEHITPSYLKFNLQTPSPVIMKIGQIIDYKIKLKGIPLRWRSQITSYDPPYHFVDEQIRGPYALWQHTHTFKEKNGTTLIEDHILYKIPFGIIGSAANSLFVKKDLTRIFQYRKEKINLIFGKEFN